MVRARIHIQIGEVHDQDGRISDMRWVFFFLAAVLVALFATYFIRNHSQSAPSPSPIAGSKATSSSATFLVTGDIMLSRAVAAKMQAANDPLLPFRGMEAILRSTDFNTGNLESPLSTSGVYDPIGGLSFNVPPGYAEGLSAYNFKVVNLANNHAFDQGLDGLAYTLYTLHTMNVQTVGAGSTPQEAWQGDIIESNGIRIGFLGASFASVNDGGTTRTPYVARIENTDRLRPAITDLHNRGADIVVVNMHAGTEYNHTPNEIQQTFARAAIDAGADIVVGAHPHWIQTIEEYRGHYIFYSLGNFIFDQIAPGTNEGLTLKVTATKNSTAVGHIATIELLPVIIEHAVPRPATSLESAAILRQIGVQNTVLTPSL